MAVALEDADLAVGERLDRYVVEAEIARGGLGVVYRARDDVLGRTVALKVIAARHARDREFRERFRRECRLAAQVEHPSVIPVYDSGQAGGRLFLAMRLVDGADLGTLLRDGPPAPARALTLIAQIAGSLDAAHAAGLVHRDVKPANVLVEGDRAFLVDFGIALARTEDIRLTRTGHWVGTPAYAAPEQIRGGAVDARTDVYALGGLLHHCLTGELPFGAADELDAISAHLFDPPPRPSAVDPRLPRGMDDVVARAMAKRPEDRYGTAGELAAAAQAALAGGTPERHGAPIPWVRVAGLPDQPAALVARRAELAAVLAALEDSRLVTLTGPGGVGKTRLALQAAADARPRFPGGVRFVPLAAITDGSLVRGAIGEVASGEATLLVLDNAEQVVDGVAEQVLALLESAPALRILATSRVRIDVGPEREQPLDPLDTADAAALFVQAARRARPDFEPGAGLDELVRGLDGLPLAVELAASRVRVLTVAQLAEQLRGGINALTTTARDVPGRQRALRAAIAWSWDLLRPAERDLLARFSVFGGTFDLDAAVAVCDAGIDAVQALTDHNLVRTDGAGRFFLLATIRAFATEQLAADPQAGTVTRARHLAHFAGRVRGGPPAVGRDAWLERALRELPDHRIALANADGETLARLVADLRMVWPLAGHVEELGMWVERARAAPVGDPALEIELLDAAGMAAHFAGRHAESAAAYESIVPIARRSGDEHAARLAQTRVATQLVHLGDVEGSERLLREVLRFADETGDLDLRTRATINLAAAALTRGDYGAAMALGEETAAAHRELGEEDLAAHALTNAGLAAVRDGQLDRGLRHLAAAMEVFARLDWAEGLAYVFVGAAAAAGDDRRAAAVLLGRAQALCELGGFQLEAFEQEIADSVRAGADASELEEGARLDDAAAAAIVRALRDRGR